MNVRKIFFLSVVFTLFSSYSFAVNFKTIFDSVDPEYRTVFETETQRLFHASLAQIRDFQKGSKSKTVFIVHDLWKTNDPAVRETQALLTQIDLQLKLAGIDSLLDIANKRPGSSLTVHQFLSQIYQENTSLILVVESGRWNDGSPHSAHIASQIIEAQRRKPEPPIFLLLGNIDTSARFSSAFSKYFPGSETTQFNLESSKIELDELLAKTYELIDLIFKQDLRDKVLQIKESLAWSLENLAKNKNKLQELLNQKQNQTKKNLENLANILGI